jgi:hypothetical protein
MHNLRLRLFRLLRLGLGRRLLEPLLEALESTGELAAAGLAEHGGELCSGGAEEPDELRMERGS